MIRLDLREIGWGACEVNSVGWRWWPVAGSCERGDKLLGSGDTFSQ
jgi:hypothetical protein